MEIEKRWIVSFLLVFGLSIIGLFWPDITEIGTDFLPTTEIVGSDVAWILTSTCLVTKFYLFSSR